MKPIKIVAFLLGLLMLALLTIASSCDKREVVEEDCICTLDYNPVCGKDGKTYGNACAAACAGVEVDFEGEC